MTERPVTALNPSAGTTPAGIIGSDDPWISAYLKLRQASTTAM